MNRTLSSRKPANPPTALALNDRMMASSKTQCALTEAKLQISL